VCRALAARWGVVDVPGGRKLHAEPTPLLGGVAVYLAFAAATILWLRPVVPIQMVLLLAGAAVFGAIGIIDDIWEAGAWKLVVEAIVVSLIVWIGGFQVSLPWPWAGQILAVLWIVGVANAMNCLDCTDGMASGVVVVAGLALAAVAIAMGRLGVAVAAFSVVGAALGFLRYNFPPARIFLGDTGSLMLGFLLGGLSAALAAPEVTGLWIAPLLVLSVPVVDFVLVHLRRYRRDMRHPLRVITSTGRDHLPHRLLDTGLSSTQAVAHVYRLCALTGASALALVLWGPGAAALPILVLLAPTGIARWRHMIGPDGPVRTWRSAARVLDASRSRTLAAAGASLDREDDSWD